MNTSGDNRSPAERVKDLPRIMHAMSQGVRRALAEHRLMGNPVAVWEDGKVKWIDAKDIPVELTTPLPDMD